MIAPLYRAWHRKFPPEIGEEERHYLSIHSHYYKDLSSEEQKRFEHRLAVSLRWFDFRVHNLPEVTTEMKIAVGAGIMQVCFGLRKYLFRRFRRIQLVPAAYTYPGLEHMPMIGDTNRNNWMISLSWPHVLEGIRGKDDGYNVVLHEVAHGLEWEHLLGRKAIRTFLHHTDYKHWKRLAAKKLHLIRQGENSFLKDYGGTNMEELFAVSIEAFFEQPFDFKKRLPYLYRQMCQVLNQDPTQRKSPVLIPRGV
ncbi:MAG: zinc-dependent peptidase [Bacteroidetes bacterium]|nr:zinc-dependent peptidase [Bacteroidota bacterium]